MADIHTPDKWVLIRVVGPRVAENFKLLAGVAPRDDKPGDWTFTTAIVSAARKDDTLEVSTASETFQLVPTKDCYAFTVKTAEIFVKMHRIAASNGMTFHVVDQPQVIDTLNRYWNGDETTQLPPELG